MAQFHFVEDYERYVAALIEKHPIDEAMSLAVGGWYEHVGAVERAVLRYVNLRNGDTVLDLGCGSGRLAWALGQSMDVQYIGIDVVASLLDYARSRSPEHYRFLLNRTLHVPAPDRSVDLACAFSLFTHLLHHESYLYLEDMRRVVRPNGLVVFSFLEFAEPTHWPIFTATVDAQRTSEVPHLNQFIERSQIETWAKRLNYAPPWFVDAREAPWGEPGCLGQTIAVLQDVGARMPG